MTWNRPRRRGLALVPALACLVLVTMLCGAMLKLVQTHRGAARDEERRMQAEWLAESGAARASARLAADDSYKGETWDIPTATLDGAGRVTIVVEAVEKAPGRRRVRVEADYPSGDDAHRARQSKQWTVDLRPENPGGPS